MAMDSTEDAVAGCLDCHGEHGMRGLKMRDMKFIEFPMSHNCFMCIWSQPLWDANWQDLIDVMTMFRWWSLSSACSSEGFTNWFDLAWFLIHINYFMLIDANRLISWIWFHNHTVVDVSSASTEDNQHQWPSLCLHPCGPLMIFVHGKTCLQSVKVLSFPKLNLLRC